MPRKKKQRRKPVLPPYSVLHAVLLVLVARGEVSRRFAENWLVFNEDRLWEDTIGPMLDKIGEEMGTAEEEALEDKDIDD